MMEMVHENIIDSCKAQIQKEADALNKVAEQVDEAYVEACHAILECKGRVIVTGLGKTGHIGRKIAASLASLGVPAFFVHSCESLHGDMGMITQDDVVIMISNSGKSAEILNMLPSLSILGVKTISITNNRNSPLALATDIKILCDAGTEIDHMGLAPTTSTTAALSIGDAIATVVSKMRGFERKDFALSHPGGALGQQLIKEYQKGIKQSS